MSAILFTMPCVLTGEPVDKQPEQHSAEQRWLFEPSSDCSGLTIGEYRRGLALHSQLEKFLQYGSFSIGSNLKMMSRLIDLHMRICAMQGIRGRA